MRCVWNQEILSWRPDSTLTILVAKGCLHPGRGLSIRAAGRLRAVERVFQVHGSGIHGARLMFSEQYAARLVQLTQDLESAKRELAALENPS